MRATLFLSSLFAVSLIGGVALAERSAEGVESRRPVRDHKIQEMRPREASTVRERAPQVRREAPSVQREPRAIKEAPTHGDNVDRSYARHVVKGGEKVHQNATPTTRALPTLKPTREAPRACAELTSSCTPRQPTTGKSSDSAAAKKEDKRELTARERARAQEMVKKLQAMMCERHAATCADYL